MSGAAESAKAAIPLAIRSWVVADLIGVVLRVVLPFDATGGLVSLAVFFGITLVVGVVGLGVWRYLYFKLR